MTNVQRTIYDKKLSEQACEAFKTAPELNMMWSGTMQSVWMDDCLYLLLADLRQRYMMVSLKWHLENYSEEDLREKMHYLLLDLKKHFAKHGVEISCPTEYKETDHECNEFSIYLKEEEE